jgi:hypothetical protein
VTTTGPSSTTTQPSGVRIDERAAASRRAARPARHGSTADRGSPWSLLGFGAIFVALVGAVVWARRRRNAVATAGAPDGSDPGGGP